MQRKKKKKYIYIYLSFLYKDEQLWDRTSSNGTSFISFIPVLKAIMGRNMKCLVHLLCQPLLEGCQLQVCRNWMYEASLLLPQYATENNHVVQTARLCLIPLSAALCMFPWGYYCCITTIVITGVFSILTDILLDLVII